MKKELQEVACHWLSNGSLDDSSIVKTIATMASDSEIDEALERFDNPSVGFRELSASAERGRISTVCSIDDWSATVVMDNLIHPGIAISPSPIAIVPINGASLEINVYEIPVETFTLSRVYGLTLPEPREKLLLNEGDVWSTPGQGVFGDVLSVSGSEDGRDPALLVINGTPYAPYTRTFDRSGDLVETVFSSQSFNGKRYFAELLKFTTSADLVECMSEEEKANLSSFVLEQVNDIDAVISEALWPLVQTAANIDPNTGLQALRVVAESSHEMSAQALKVLQNHNSKAGS